MIDQLISEGEKLQHQIKQGTVGKYLNGVDFEAWVAKTILFLEKNHKDSSLTEKALVKNKELSQRSSVHTYEFLLGTLKAIKESA
ncbi:hypothetical protein P4H46_21105 [Paenibacillus glucanolyticus]|uniref:hypothetical protein n=1 Tax=Paenibacillus glucanolyticus TaxID=59843 RepID=UPI0030C9BB9F